MENNATTSTISSAIGVWGSNNVTVDGNRVDEADGGGWQECISVDGTDTFEVRNNEVLNCHKEGICVDHAHAHTGVEIGEHGLYRLDGHLQQDIQEGAFGVEERPQRVVNGQGQV